jgi:hypothetical protein
VLVVSSLAFGPAGGALVALAGFTAASGADAVSFAAVAGLIVGAQAAGGITAALTVARRGSAARPGPAAALGLAVIAAGELLLGLAPVKAPLSPGPRSSAHARWLPCSPQRSARPAPGTHPRNRQRTTGIDDRFVQRRRPQHPPTPNPGGALGEPRRRQLGRTTRGRAGRRRERAKPVMPAAKSRRCP